MKLVRPYIPYSVRVTVAARQAVEAGVYPRDLIDGWPYARQLRELLYVLFGDERMHLDHNPALENRQKRYHNGVHVAYSPPANDPDYLIYRTAESHRIKTSIRGDHGQYSDAALRRREKKRVQTGHAKTRRDVIGRAESGHKNGDDRNVVTVLKRKIPHRKKYKWAKRKMQSRNVSCHKH